MDTIEKIKKAEINPEYDLEAEHLCQISKEAAGEYIEVIPDNFYSATYLGFKLGYMQGMKAKQAEYKKNLG